MIVQSGAENKGSILQINQGGILNQALIAQNGSGHSSNITQAGCGNVAGTLQY